ncbi:hypothetical protein DL764_006012 [Monosporascus ibericus]|uniref:Uncharacterized protein n=1 Tax=Monosporascus ibericus TaxID=155417 RepID=A0A4Q4T6H7_9PEZI|nr:hypothetical protein DL764_006012 [Monosporascus ibericus]
MKTSVTIILTCILFFRSASACTPATAEDVTPYLNDWGIGVNDPSTGDEISTGGNSHCTNVLVEYGVDAWDECIEDTITGIDVNFKPRLVKKNGNLWLAGRQSTLECTGDEICGVLPPMPDEVFCMDSGSGEWHSADGSNGNWQTGEIHLADGTSGNVYTGEIETDSGSGGRPEGSGSSEDGDSETSSATSLVDAGKVVVFLMAAIATTCYVI